MNRDQQEKARLAALSERRGELTANDGAEEAAFRKAANKWAALEARLTEENRGRYAEVRRKQHADLERQEQRLAALRREYES